MSRIGAVISAFEGRPAPRPIWARPKHLSWRGSVAAVSVGAATGSEVYVVASDRGGLGLGRLVRARMKYPTGQSWPVQPT